MDDPDNYVEIDNLAADLTAVFRRQEGDGAVTKTYDQTSTTSKVKGMLDKVFIGLISITMFLCFFSLCASMSANLYEQKKEIGVLRAIGFTKYRVRMLYFYEALVLVLSSCIMGVVIGMTMGYTMVSQANLFIVTHIEPFFPWGQFLLVLFLSLLCAFFSTWGPARNLTNRQIAGIFRLV